MKDQQPDLLLSLGFVTGALTNEETCRAFLETLASDEPGRERVWRYTQRLRNDLTDLLRRAGRE